MTTRNKIVVAGHSPEVRNEILQGLVGSHPGCNSSLSADIRVFPSKLDTKYYSADVEYWNINVELLDSSADASVGEVADALVLVFDVFQESSFQKIQRWLPFVERHSPSVLLCVGSFESESNPDAHRDYFTSDSYASHTDWCLDNGLEFVAMVETPGNDADSDEASSAFKERFGLERITEALHSHMWPGMVFKTDLRPRQAPRSIPRASDSNADADHENGVSEPSVSDAAPGPAASTPEASAFGELARRALLQSLPKKDDELQLADEPDHATLADERLSFEDLSRKFMRGLGDPDSLEETMAQLSALRLKAQSMPDSERRELAAQLALAFCADLGDEFDDDDDGMD
eukprot:TRINITY_DN5810_c0_g1_i1.p1 TRINITY_DN5810_c0_g1~~TRINITY_DN5810_c0_g1_i1.p1  ORF type:complete len:346 (+),score=60.84 TRINITY_DN5810_c0_g1_i1:61-1098(+)